MKIAIIHDWLITFGGAERTLEQMLICFPEADIFTLIDFLPERDRGFLEGKNIYTSFLQKFPFIENSYRKFLPLMPLAIEQFQLNEYDLVISSCHAVSKGVLVGPDQLHVCYCYTPIRYAWDLQFQYLKETNLLRGLKSWLARALLHQIRIWDVRSEKGVDHFIAISKYISRRIKKAYRRDSNVIYPPVDTDAFSLTDEKKDFYLTASRLVPYKKVSLIIEAFSKLPDKSLIVIGDGPDLNKCISKATENVKVLGWQPNEVLKKYMQEAKAFVYAAEEDFGIVPIEAQSCGTPVICFAKGALLETVRGINVDSPTGIFFDEQSVDSIQRAILQFEEKSYMITSRACRENALNYSKENFRHLFGDFIKNSWHAFKNDINK